MLRVRHEDMNNEDLRLYLHTLNLKQTDLARLLGLMPRTIRKWVQGTLPVPTYAAIVLRLMHSGKVTVEDIKSAAA